MMRGLRQTLDAFAVPLGAAAIGAVAWRSWRVYNATPRAGASDDATPALATWPTLPSVSVLVPAWNEAEHVDALVDSFNALTYPSAELIVCAGGTDGTFERAKQYESDRVRVIEQIPGDGKQGALRRSIAVARGDTIMLSDADCRFVDEAFLRLLAPLASGDYAVATGVAEPSPQQRRSRLVEYQWLIDRWWHHQYADETDGLLGRNCALTREALEQIGGFDADVRTGTDYHLAHTLQRAGYRIRAVPSSRVVSDYPTGARDYVRMYERWHKNLLIHGPGFGAWGDVRALLTAFAAYAVAAGLPLLVPFAGRLALVIPGVLLGTSMLQRFARACAGARLAGEPVPRSLLPTTIVATVLDIVAVMLAVYATFNPQRRARW